LLQKEGFPPRIKQPSRKPIHAGAPPTPAPIVNSLSPYPPCKSPLLFFAVAFFLPYRSEPRKLVRESPQSLQVAPPVHNFRSGILFLDGNSLKFRFFFAGPRTLNPRPRGLSKPRLCTITAFPSDLATRRVAPKVPSTAVVSRLQKTNKSPPQS